jgi:hypothetical protein
MCLGVHNADQKSLKLDRNRVFLPPSSGVPPSLAPIAHNAHIIVLINVRYRRLDQGSGRATGVVVGQSRPAAGRPALPTRPSASSRGPALPPRATQSTVNPPIIRKRNGGEGRRRRNRQAAKSVESWTRENERIALERHNVDTKAIIGHRDRQLLDISLAARIGSGEFTALTRRLKRTDRESARVHAEAIASLRKVDAQRDKQIASATALLAERKRDFLRAANQRDMLTALPNSFVCNVHHICKCTVKLNQFVRWRHTETEKRARE